MRRRLVPLVALLLLAGCSSGAEEDADGDKEPKAAPDSANRVDLVAKDYSFDIAKSFEGGLVSVVYKNTGKQPHFVAFARPTGNATVAEAKAAITAPPQSAPEGPAPYEVPLGVAVTDPGGGSTTTFNLEPGGYVLFCELRAPDGQSHVAKGMVAEVEVTEVGETLPLELPKDTVTAVDFSFKGSPKWSAGKNTFGLTNDGNQIHEVDIGLLDSGTTIDDVLAWFNAPDGPPPLRSLGGPAVGRGGSATAEITLEAGSTYIIFCAIPDALTDFRPHIAKGMHSAPFKV